MIKKLMLSMLAVLGLASSTPALAQQDDNVDITTYNYAIIGNDTLKIDLYQRRDLKDKKQLPTMLYVHGGGFVGGSRKNAAQEIFLRHYAQQGYLGASMDYRLGGATEAMKPQKYGCKSTLDVIRLAAKDMATATAWLITKGYSDEKKIIISGGSAGAFTIMQGEYDLCNDMDYMRKQLPDSFNYAGVVAAAGTISIEPDKELTWKHAPCPFFILQGDSDIVVTEAAGPMFGMKMFGAQTLHKVFTKAGYPHWVYIEKGADHVVAMSHLTNNFEETDKFIRMFINEKKGLTVLTEWHDAVPANMKDVNQMVKYVPMYILGYDKYLKDIDWGNMQKPDDVVY